MSPATFTAMWGTVGRVQSLLPSLTLVSTRSETLYVYFINVDVLEPSHAGTSHSLLGLGQLKGAEAQHRNCA